MTRRVVVGVVLLAVAPAGLDQCSRRPPAPLALSGRPRVLVFAPHPDDETVALGGLLYRLAHARLPVRVVFVTSGDGYRHAAEKKFDRQEPADTDYVALGALREREARAAARHLGLKRHNLVFLGFPDGCLAELWRAYWSRPYTSPYTNEARPPYPDSLSPDVEYEGRDLTSLIGRLLADFRPTVVVLPHPADRHADHAHTSYFVTDAVRALQERRLLPPSLTLVAYLVHYPSWPARRGPLWDRLRPLAGVPDTTWTETELSAAEFAGKRAALAEYRSQLEVMNGFLRSFLCRNELYASVNERAFARIASVH